MGASSDPVYARPDQKRRCAQGVRKAGPSPAADLVSLVKNAAVWRDGLSDLTPLARRSKVAVTPNHERSLVPTDNSLEDAVLNRLELDPRIPDSNDIAVSADDGMVVLRGSVESFGQRRAAVEDARTVGGVYDVDDQLKVDLLDGDRREDDEIRGVVLQALIWDTEVPSDSIDVKVQEGWITLKGDVTYQFQSDAAYDDVATLYGVYGVTNEIKVNEV
jgi:osmotically-inducible protein OsmY